VLQGRVTRRINRMRTCPRALRACPLCTCGGRNTTRKWCGGEQNGRRRLKMVTGRRLCGSALPLPRINRTKFSAPGGRINAALLVYSTPAVRLAHYLLAAGASFLPRDARQRRVCPHGGMRLFPHIAGADSPIYGGCLSAAASRGGHNSCALSADAFLWRRTALSLTNLYCARD